MLFLVVSMGIAYVFGSIPTAFWAGKLLKGLDIREHGSKNMGATNAFRVLGKWPGIVVLVIDIAKGIVPLVIASECFGLSDYLSLVLVGAAAVAGHNWTMFLGFKGGKGVATSLGMLIGLTIYIPEIRVVLLLTVITWIILFLAFGYVSLASIIASVSLPVLMVILNHPFLLKIMAIILCVFVVLRHRPNIARLIQGKENRVRMPWLKKDN